jgi:hypothetical protein
MSQKEFQRVKVIENAAGGRLSVREASHLLQLSERQARRLKRRYQPDSVGWVQHGNRGRSMPWAQKQLILNLAWGKCRLQHPAGPIDGLIRASDRPCRSRGFAGCCCRMPVVMP